MDIALNTLFGFPVEKELAEEINTTAKRVQVEQGEEMIRPGQSLKYMPILIRGNIKVMRPHENGGHLLLYHLEQGQTCSMTLNCCMADAQSEIYAIAETSTELLMIPIHKMEEWMKKYHSWRKFILNSYHSRMMEMLESIDSIAFSHMDARLERYLSEKAHVQGKTQLSITHQEIAEDLNTSRVVISRLLKKMESEQKIQLQRNLIQLL